MEPPQCAAVGSPHGARPRRPLQPSPRGRGRTPRRPMSCIAPAAAGPPRTCRPLEKRTPRAPAQAALRGGAPRGRAPTPPVSLAHCGPLAGPFWNVQRADPRARSGGQRPPRPRGPRSAPGPLPHRPPPCGALEAVPKRAPPPPRRRPPFAPALRAGSRGAVARRRKRPAALAPPNPRSPFFRARYLPLCATFGPQRPVARPPLEGERPGRAARGRRTAPPPPVPRPRPRCRRPAHSWRRSAARRPFFARPIFPAPRAPRRPPRPGS
jgi:hypothetical protein